MIEHSIERFFFEKVEQKNLMRILFWKKFFSQKISKLKEKTFSKAFREKSGNPLISEILKIFSAGFFSWAIHPNFRNLKINLWKKLNHFFEGLIGFWWFHQKKNYWENSNSTTKFPLSICTVYWSPFAMSTSFIARKYWLLLMDKLFSKIIKRRLIFPFLPNSYWFSNCSEHL